VSYIEYMPELIELPEDGIFRDSLVTKGTVGPGEDTLLVEISRDPHTGVIGSGISEGEVRNGVKIKLKRRILDFVEKVFNRDYFVNKKFEGITLKKIVENHSKLKRLGFPVVNTMRMVDTPPGYYERIIMTDLTEGGKKMVLSSASYLDDEPQIENISNGNEVGIQLSEIYQKLNQEGVQICHHDVFFLVIDKETRKGEIVLGDVSRVIFSDDPEFSPRDDEIEANNYENMKDFVDLVNRSLTGRVVDFSPVRERMMANIKT